VDSGGFLDPGNGIRQPRLYLTGPTFMVTAMWMGSAPSSLTRRAPEGCASNNWGRKLDLEAKIEICLSYDI